MIDEKTIVRIDIRSPTNDAQPRRCTYSTLLAIKIIRLPLVREIGDLDHTNAEGAFVYERLYTIIFYKEDALEKGKPFCPKIYAPNQGQRYVSPS
jgi:hypothetical protein